MRLPGYRHTVEDPSIAGGFAILREQFGGRAGEVLLDSARRAILDPTRPALARYAAAVFVQAHDEPERLERLARRHGQNSDSAAWSLMSLLSIMLWKEPPRAQLIRRTIAVYITCLCDEPTFPAPCPGCEWQIKHR